MQDLPTAWVVVAGSQEAFDTGTERRGGFVSRQLLGKWTRFQIASEVDCFGVVRICNLHNDVVDENTKLKSRVKELELFLIDLAKNFDCDSDAHRYGTQCRSCTARNLVEAVK